MRSKNVRGNNNVREGSSKTTANTSHEGNGPLVNSKTGQQFALVKWLSGDCKGTLTHNVHVEWIRNFDPSADVFEDSYVVEWRNLPQPRSGWPIYEAEVLEVSENEDFLKQKMLQLEDEDNDSSRGSSASPTPSNAAASTPSLASHNVLKELVNVMREVVRSPRTPRSRSEPLASHDTPNKPSKALIGKKLLVTRTAYNTAKHASSPERMVGILLKQAFTVKRLQDSTYAGQKRTQPDGTVVVKPMLKKYQKMVDIQNFVLEKFPHLSQSSFSLAVNSFLGEKKNQDEPMQYVDDSESDGGHEN